MDASDAVIGSEVVIYSLAGIAYAGIVRSISGDRGEGELFELGRYADPTYQRFVHVTDRGRQIRIPPGSGEARVRV